MVKDLVIIGLGPAGIAASIYAKRSGLDVLVFESKMPGGLLNYTNVVNNYPGFINITGPDLAMKMFEHFSTFNIEYKNEDVTKIEDGKIKTVYTQKGKYKCKNIIIATGRSRRSLNLEGESDLVGKGISYCALCDGHFYKDKNVAVVGAGDSSLEESLYLAKIAKNVTIIVRGKSLAGNKSLVDEVNKTENIEVLFNKNVIELITDNGKLSGLKLDDGKDISVNGLFVYIGFDPIIPFADRLAFNNDKGYLIVDKNFETSVEGIYAVGDIIKKDLYQIVSATFEGASAANAVVRKLTTKD